MHFLLLALLIMLSSCSTIWDSLRPYPKPPPAPLPVGLENSSEVTHIIQDYTVELKYKHRLHLEHADTYYNENGIKTIKLEFISQDIIEMCEARELIVDMTENLLGRLNQNPILAPDFPRYPFDVTQLEIYITFESFFGKYIDPMYIIWICMEDGNISYYTFDIEDKENRCWHSRNETYATSREIVVYQREAEDKYAEIEKQKKISIFGSDRYMPPEDEPNSARILQ